MSEKQGPQDLLVGDSPSHPVSSHSFEAGMQAATVKNQWLALSAFLFSEADPP